MTRRNSGTRNQQALDFVDTNKTVMADAGKIGPEMTAVDHIGTERRYALGDLHGHLACLRTALEKVDLEGDPGAELVLLGDYIDRGPQSAEVLYALHELHQQFPERVVVLLGNHEDWFLDWLDADDEDLSWLMGDTDLVTVTSFLSPQELAHALGHDDPSSDASVLYGPTMNGSIKRAIIAQHSELIAWLRTLPRIYETDDQIFVHAGVDEEAGELWRAATPDYVLTEKYPATVGPFIKTIVAGHVATSQMHTDCSHGVFFDGESHYYVDGSVEQTGRVNVLKYTVADGVYDAFVVDPAAYSSSFVVAENLDDLNGPSTDEVTLPNRLLRNPSRPFDLSDEKRLRSMLRTVLREASSQQDLAEYLERDSLVRLWPTLGLPERIRKAWEQRFPELAEPGEKAR